MKKIDLRKEYRHLYGPSAKKADLVDVPEFSFLMVDGQGDPNTTQAYKDAVEALYTLSYTLKFMIKKGDAAVDYGVMPLEGLWWADDLSVFTSGDRDGWLWTMMIMQPEYVTEELVQAATDAVRRRKNPPGLPRVRFEAFREGEAAQILHIGPFTEEGPTIEGLHTFIEESGRKLGGKHHEIYLSDIRRAAPQRWKTIIRQPIA